MEVTLSGTVMEMRFEQSWKAHISIEATLLGMLTEVRLVQFSKAFSPIMVTLPGMVTSPPLPAYSSNIPDLMIKSVSLSLSISSLFFSLTGYPHPGQVGAISETSLPHSGQLISVISCSLSLKLELSLLGVLSQTIGFIAHQESA
jgi:hypothetical protein